MFTGPNRLSSSHGLTSISGILDHTPSVAKRGCRRRPVTLPAPPTVGLLVVVPVQQGLGPARQRLGHGRVSPRIVVAIADEVVGTTGLGDHRN